MEGTCVGSTKDISSKGRLQTKVEGRDIVVFFYKVTEKFFALDTTCYHAGGPLQTGDIEDIAGHPCVICPLHKHKICLDTGESLYQKINMANPDKPVWASKGVRQRTHNVTVKDGKVYVKLSDLKTDIESDYYNSESYKKRMAELKEEQEKYSVKKLKK